MNNRSHASEENRIRDFFSFLDVINVPSRDDGSGFIERGRWDGIIRLLSESSYEPIRSDGLAQIYRHRNADLNGQAILISSHIDTEYEVFFHRELGEDELIGSFDNSICNAIIVMLMLDNRLHENVIVAFTGDEEVDGRGSAEVMDFLIEHRPQIWANLQLVITMDVTDVGYRNHAYTIENCFIEKEVSALHFKTKEDFARFLVEKTGNGQPRVIIDAVADESWYYDEYDLNCFSLCLPSRPHPDNSRSSVGEWMHDDRGIIVKKNSIPIYSEALINMCRNILNG